MFIYLKRNQKLNLSKYMPLTIIEKENMSITKAKYHVENNATTK